MEVKISGVVLQAKIFKRRRLVLLPANIFPPTNKPEIAPG
jgi:hypothetical protein